MDIDIIDFAMRMEQDGKLFYEQAASNTSDPELKEILLTLAEEERNHYEFFKKMKDGPVDLAETKNLSGANTLKKVQNIFEAMSKNKDASPFGDNVIDLWTQALRTEEKAVKLYQEQADKENDPARKELFLRIAREEQNHVAMIDGVLMYVKHPAAFAESAQFKNYRSLEGL